MREMFHKIKNESETFGDEQRNIDLNKLVTIHPIKNENNLYKFHHLIQVRVS